MLTSLPRSFHISSIFASSSSRAFFSRSSFILITHSSSRRACTPISRVFTVCAPFFGVSPRMASSPRTPSVAQTYVFRRIRSKLFNTTEAKAFQTKGTERNKTKHTEPGLSMQRVTIENLLIAERGGVALKFRIILSVSYPRSRS